MSKLANNAHDTDNEGRQQASSSTPDMTKKRKLEDEVVVKDEWTDDSDDDIVQAEFKRRIEAKNKTKAATRKPAANTRGRGKDRGKKKRSRANSSPGPSNESLSKKMLPEYVLARRRAFDDNRAVLREGGLRLPPDFEDIGFSDDENSVELERKPKFDDKDGILPSRPYRDIHLEDSLGTIPASIAQYLRDYQVEGVRFLHHLFVYQNGGILGDDMGLGKTVQVAAFLTAAFGKTGDQRDTKRMRKFRRHSERWYPRALIICPGAVIENWKRELDRWGWWQTGLYHGTKRDEDLKSARSGMFEVMITTYSTYKVNMGQINGIEWDVVVADECHCIKDPSSEVTQAMNEVNALCRIGLTGTAIQNKYEELYVLLNWTNPGRFGTMSEWKDKICKPLTLGQSHDATPKQIKNARETAHKLVHNLLPQFFLRRTKSLIAHQLPKKTDKVVFCPLSAVQTEAYENFLGGSLVDLVKSAYLDCECGSGSKRGWCCYKKTEDGESWRSLVFPLIISLQKMSNHLMLLIPQNSDGQDKQNRELRYLKAAMPDKWRELYKKREDLVTHLDPKYCGKWAILKKLLQLWHGTGDKVLVFSHSVRFLKILFQLFQNTSYIVSYLDGAVKYEDRQKIVDDFQSDPEQFVFLISTKAGGVGLNITSANKVVIMDPHWNPAYDLQAQDRAYRIGQVRDVDVYRLVSAGTIEEITYARQIYKQQQANIGYTASNERRYFKGVQQNSSRKGEIFGIDNIFSFHGDQPVLRDIVNKTNIAEAKVGVSLIEVDIDKANEDDELKLIKKEEDGNEHGGLDQLAAYLTMDDKAKAAASQESQKAKSDPVLGILASVGVEYSHENSEVVGSSKVEEQISRRAQLDSGEDLDTTGRAVFVDLDDDDDDLGAGHDGVKIRYKYKPPEDVCHRQFVTMSRMFGFPSATEFALVVEGMTQEQRRNTLDKFYKMRIERLKELGEIKADVDEEPAAQMKGKMKEEAKKEEEGGQVSIKDESQPPAPSSAALVDGTKH